VDQTLQYAIPLITFGALMLLGNLTDAVGHRTKLPRVTLLLVFGIAIGPEALDLLPRESIRWFPVVSEVALTMVGFLLGGQLTAANMRERGKSVLVVSLVVTAATLLLIWAGLTALGVDPALALMLAAIGGATAPAATLIVVSDAKATGPFTQLLLGVVAVDDVWGIIAFSLFAAAAGMLSGGTTLSDSLTLGAVDIFGAVALGIAIGVPMAIITGRLPRGEPTLLEALGAVFLCGGLALHFHVSLLLSAVTLGAVVANLAKHHTRPFHAIENIDGPFFVLFFMLSGASLELSRLLDVGVLGVGYVVLRVLGRLAGGWLGTRMVQEPPVARRWLGPALLPQAGVAVGMALVGAQRFPDLAQSLFTVVIGSTVLFELVGPLLTRLALSRVGEVGAGQGDHETHTR